MISPALFCRIGDALYGTGWERAMSLDLGIHERTIRRWAGGQRVIPIEVKPRLVALIEGRGDSLAELRTELEK